MHMARRRRVRIGPILIVALLARVAGAQVADTITRVTVGAAVSGIVRDSIARAPLAGAMVQLVAADNPARFGRTAVSDSLGRFTLSDVPDGRYLMGFFHPVLDSLGIEPPVREVYVNGRQPVRADLGVPSPARLRVAICGRQAAQDDGAVVVGIVRDTRDGSPAAGVTVAGEWLEMSLRRGQVDGQTPRLATTTWESGWFAMCNVPRSATMFLLASRGGDSTDLIEVQIPASGFLHRDLYLGPAGTAPTGDSAQRTGNLASRRRPLHMGDGRLTGSVVNADGWPLAGALVRITDGPETRTNAEGEWTLGNAPVGTRMLEVRTLGYYPDRRRVDVVTNGQPVRVTLSTLEAVLDTVRIMSKRLNVDDSGFEDRRRKGVGHFLTPKDIARRQPIAVSDLFRSLPGVLLEGGVEKRIVMRGAFGKCEPAIYINGMPMTSQRANGGVVTIAVDDIDGWMRPRDVTGIEIYAGDSAPVEYQQGMSGCGSILLWMKLRH